MSIQRQLIRGNTATIEALTPLPAQVGFDTDKKELHVGDGVTVGAVRLAKKNIRDILTPAQITGDVADYSPAGLKHAGHLMISTDAFRDITGMVPTTVTNDTDGREITIYNVGANNARLVDQSAASAAANRFDLGGASLTLAPKTSATLRYSKALTRWVLIAQTVGSSVGSGAVIAMTLAASSQGYSLLNGVIACSVAGGALTIAIKTLAGNDPSALDPVLVKVRSGTLANGGFTVITLTAATSFVVSSGSSLGAIAATAFRLWLVGFNDGGTFRLGVVNCLLGVNELPLLKTNALITSTAEGGAGAADASGVFYTGTAVATKPFEVLGYLDYPAGLAVAGTWNILPTTIQPFHAAIRLPTEELLDPSNNRIYVNRVMAGTPDGRLFYRDDRNLAYPLKGQNAANYALTDWNNAHVPGVYDGTGLANAPNGDLSNWFYVEVTQHSNYVAGTNVYVGQTAQGMTIPGKWVRTCINGSWGAWRRLDTRVLLATVTASNIASFDAPTVFSANPDFRNFEVIFENVAPATNLRTTILRLYVGGTLQVANYSSVLGYNRAGTVTNVNAAVTYLQLTGNAGTGDSVATGQGFTGRLFFVNPRSTSTQKTIIGQTRTFPITSSVFENNATFTGGWIGSNAALDGLNLAFDAGNVASGTMLIYGTN